MITFIFGVYEGDFYLYRESIKLFYRYHHLLEVIADKKAQITLDILEGKTRDQIQEKYDLTKQALVENIYRIADRLGLEERGEEGIRKYFRGDGRFLLGNR